MAAVSEFEYRYNMTIKTFPSHAEPSFESAVQQQEHWGENWGCSNDVGQIRKVLMHRPGEEMSVIDPSMRLEHLGSFGDAEGQSWYWRGDVIPTLAEQQVQHDALADLLRQEGAEVVYLNRCAPGKHKSIYTRDSCIGVKGGAIVTRLGPNVRRGEEAPVSETLAGIGMPILRTIHGTGLMEGGSFVWLNSKTAVIGRSSRVNSEGAKQVEEVLNAQGVDLLCVDLTGYRLHIDGALVMIDVDTAIINPTQLPFWFLEKLDEMNIRTIEINPGDPGGVVNCIAVRPGRVIMQTGLSPRTADELDKLGIEILSVDYSRVYLGGGGVHCSTAPLIRESVD